MLNILVVDDSLVMRRKITEILTNLGHKVIATANCGKEAVSIARKLESKIDLITMDITMPDMNGIVAVARIKEYIVSAKIIMITSHGQEDMVIKALRGGAKGYVLKPICMKTIQKAISNIFPQYTCEDEDELLDD